MLGRGGGGARTKLVLQVMSLDVGTDILETFLLLLK